jgi:hypothetical protein
MTHTKILKTLVPLMLLFATAVHSKTIVAETITYGVTGVPNELMALKMDNPSATFGVVINSRGDVIDVLCTESTHYGLLEDGIKFINKTDWKLPEDVKDPNRHSFTLVLSFIDYEQRNWRQSNGSFVPQGGTGFDGLAAKIYRTSPDSYRYHRSKAKDLDDPIRLVEGGIVVVQDKNGQPAKGSALVEFYVGPEGNTHFPNFIETDGNLVTDSVIKTLDKLKFTPPTRNSKPTFVLVKQQFNFS